MLKKLFCCLLLLMSFTAIELPALQFDPVYAADKSEKASVQVDIVYDDSKSMLDENRILDAKYSMEVFASMMGQNDLIKVYPLSGAKQNSDPIVIRGSENPQSRVSLIQKMNGENNTGNYDGYYTPYQAVEQAANDIKLSDYSQKWLVVMTDGDFNTGENTESREAEVLQLMNNAADIDTRVVYVGIGKEAKHLTGNFETVMTDASGILNTVSELAEGIFSLKSVDVTSGTPSNVTIDIPVSKLIIFAQGNNVEVSNVELDHRALTEKAMSVDVYVDETIPGPDEQYAKKTYPSFGYDAASNLRGKVITYEASSADDPMSSGTYSFSSNVDSANINVYFEPGLNIQPVFIPASDPEKQINLLEQETISDNSGTVLVELINPITGDKVDPSDTEMLNGTTMYMVVTDENGNSITARSGDQITLEPGKYSVFSVVDYGDGITQQTETRTITFLGEPVTLLLTLSSPNGEEKDPEIDTEFQFNVQDYKNNKNECILVKVQAQSKSGALRDLTEDEWDAGVKSFHIQSHGQRWVLPQSLIPCNHLSWKAEKGDQLSTYRLYLSNWLGPWLTPGYSDVDISLNIKLASGIQEDGSTQTVVYVTHYPDWVIWTILSGIALLILLIIFYMLFMFLKTRIPRDMKAGWDIDNAEAYDANGWHEPINRDALQEFKCSPGKIRNKYSLFRRESQDFLFVTDSGTSFTLTVSALKRADIRRQTGARYTYEITGFTAGASLDDISKYEVFGDENDQEEITKMIAKPVRGPIMFTLKMRGLYHSSWSIPGHISG